MKKQRLIRVLGIFLSLVILLSSFAGVAVSSAEVEIEPTGGTTTYTMNVGDTKYIFLDVDEAVTSAAWFSTAPFDVEIIEQDSVHCVVRVNKYVKTAAIQCNYYYQTLDPLNNRMYLIQAAEFFTININEPPSTDNTGNSGNSGSSGSTGGSSIAGDSSSADTSNFNTDYSEFLSYSGTASSVAIPEKINGVTITTIKSLGNKETLNNVLIPATVEFIEADAFLNTTGLKSICVDSNNPNFSSVDGVLYNKDKTELVCFPPAKSAEAFEVPEGVTTIGENAFGGCKNVSSVKLSSSVDSIEKYGFKGCTGLTSVTIPESVKIIGNSAFEGCTRLTSVTISEGVESIGEHVFYECTSLTSVTIPGSVKSMGRCVFLDCTGLTSVTISEGVESIAVHAFNGCTGLTSVTIPESVKKIEESAFKGCSGLTSVTIPWGVKSIGNYAFSGCTGLTSVTIPEGVNSIGTSAFYDCTSLSSVIIPESVNSIGNYAFEGCTRLVDIKLSDALEVGCDVFKNTSYLKNSENWEDGVLYIGNVLIKAKTSLNGAYSIKEGTKVIAKLAFDSCTGLTSLTIPESVESIGYNAFYDCKKLSSIETLGNWTVVYWNSFSGTAYQNNQSNWKDDVMYIGNALICADDSISGDYNVKEGTVIIAHTAFEDCNNLGTLTIPEDVNCIGKRAFNRCANLKNIYYAGTTEEWIQVCKADVPSDCKIHYAKRTVDAEYGDFIYSDTAQGEIVLTGYTGDEEYVVIPEKIVDMPVTKIAEDAFRSEDKLRVYIPDTVKEIEANAFDVPDAHIVYVGTSAQWKAITIGEGNDILYYGTRHYEGDASAYEESKVAATCKEQGYILHGCIYCDDFYKTDFEDTVDHNVVEGKCVYCEEEFSLVESEHDYASDTDYTWTVEKTGAETVILKFSDKTMVEKYYDFIYVYDKDDTQIGKYTGDELAGKVLEIPGDTAKIRLVTDDANCFYGFRAEYSFVLPEEPEFVGDANGDNKVNIKDATLIQKYAASLETLDDTQLILADVNSDTNVNVKDATAIQKYIAGIETGLPIGKEMR